MTLRVIGSGFGRTGTMTLKVALEQLGFGPTHHMLEVVQNPAQQEFWKSAFRGEEIDWSCAFEGFNSQVDFPGAAYWHEMMIAFPNAKIIHTERPEEDWWASFDGTIGKSLRHLENLPVPPELQSLFSGVRNGLMRRVFSDFSDKTAAIESYRENNRKIREIVPPSRRLIFNVSEGWQPLCEFLEVDVPQIDFPHRNIRSDFWAHFGGEPAAA